MKRGIKENITAKKQMFDGLCGGDAFRVKNNNNSGLVNKLNNDAAAYAMAIGERNVDMGQIVAVPTAGAAGILPGVLYSLYKNQKISEEKIIKALFIAGAIGLVIANRATLAGSEAGCQAECGAAGAMAAGATAYLKDGSIDFIDNAAAIALNNSLGLVCDPISGLVAVPCIQRNGIFANLAISAAAMAMAGVNFVVLFDEVADTMYRVGKVIPCQLRETSKGGLAITKTGIHFNKILLSREHI
jgi:L-serine dehydratase